VSALRVVLLREGRYWLAQGLEHDIGVQGEDLKDTLVRLEIALESEAAILPDLPPAPPYFQQLWPNKAGLFAPDRPIAGVAVDLAIVA
jgi:hypothetical protein